MVARRGYEGGFMSRSHGEAGVLRDKVNTLDRSIEMPRITT